MPFQLEHQVAVRYKVQFSPKNHIIHDKIMTPEAFENLQKRAANPENNTVIVEAWTIGYDGHCISN